MWMRYAYLEKLAVAAVKDELERDVRPVLDAVEARRLEVDGEAERALAGDLEEWNRLRKVAEVRGVFQSGKQDSH